MPFLNMTLKVTVLESYCRTVYNIIYNFNITLQYTDHSYLIIIIKLDYMHKISFYPLVFLFRFFTIGLHYCYDDKESLKTNETIFKDNHIAMHLKVKK